MFPQQARLTYISIALIAVFGFSITFCGFFLNTTKISDTSTVTQTLLSDTASPWFKPKMKVVMLVVDALRFDYFHYNESIVGHEQYPYQNRFKKLNQLTKENPDNFVEIRTYADPPTWTVQRIQCLATGNVPPYIRIAQSLKAEETEEDSILRQVKVGSKTAFAIGDPLWRELFPTVIDGFSSQSFNIWDLESEKIVANIMLDAVKKNEYDMVIGHRLGVDHAGHFFESELDPRVGEQLEANDNLAVDIINNMDDNTVLFILGDHGQRVDGHHGGTDEKETSTVIAAYSKKGFRKHKTSGLDAIMRSLDEKPTESMMQVDLAPTLAMMLGVPIPFSSLGQIINDFYPNVPQDKIEGDSTSSFVADILRDNHLNTLQIHNYLVTFQDKTHFFNNDDLASLYSQYEEIQKDYQRVSSIDHQTSEFQEQTVQLILKMQSFSANTYQLVKATSSYNIFLVSVGMLLTILAVCAFILLTIRINISQDDTKTFQDVQNWTLQEALKELMTDKFLYCVMISALIVRIALRPATIYVVSGAMLVLVTKAVGAFGLSVYSLYKKISFHDIRAASVEKAKISCEDPERQREDKNHIQTQKGPETHKALYSLLRNPYTQMILALSAMISVISCVNVFDWRISFINCEVVQRFPLPSFILTLLYFAVRYLKKDHLIVAITLIVGLYAYIRHDSPAIPWSIVQPQLALFLFAYFVYERVKRLQHSGHRLSLKYFHLATCCALWYYFTCTTRETIALNIFFPKIIYGLILASSLAGCILAPRSISENLQLCLIELLLLMQPQEVILSYALLLSMLRFINFLFKNLHSESFVYPIFIAGASFVGFFMLDHSDRYLNRLKFTQAFIGISNYNALLSPLMIFLNTYSCFILGMVYMVTYRQSISSKQYGLIQRVDEEDSINQEDRNTVAQPEQNQSTSNYAESTSSQIESTKDQETKQSKLNLLKIRNNMLFVLFFGMVYMVTMIRCYQGRNVFILLTKGNEPFILDGSIYLISLISVIPLMF